MCKQFGLNVPSKSWEGLGLFLILYCLAGQLQIICLHICWHVLFKVMKFLLGVTASGLKI